MDGSRTATAAVGIALRSLAGPHPLRGWRGFCICTLRRLLRTAVKEHKERKEEEEGEGAAVGMVATVLPASCRAAAGPLLF